MKEKIDYLNEIENIVGSDRYEKFSLGGIVLTAMNVIELDIVLDLVKEIQLRKTKSTLIFNPELANKIFELMNRNLAFINVFGMPFERMDEGEMKILLKLIENMKLRSKGYKIINGQFESYGKKISLKLNEEIVEINMEYHPYLIEKIRSIPSYSYKKAKKMATIHISQWPIFEEKLEVTQLEMVRAYQKWKDYNSINRLRLTNQGCYLTGVNLPVQEIHYATSFPDLNAKHMEAFQNGSWDGRVALYDKGTGFLPYGLLGKVLNILKQRNVTFEYTDERIRPQKRHDFQLNVNLRDYQQRTLDIAMREGRGILQLATGAGKTKTASAIVSTYGMNTIFFVHTKFLLGQAKEALEEVLGEEVGQVGDGIIDIKRVSVAMVQTTMRALGEEYKPSDDDMDGDSSMYEDDTDISKSKDEIVRMLDECEVIFFDECQFVAAETFYKIANRCNAYYKYGLSATPYRSDKKDLMIEAALGPVIDRINASYLIERGFLTRPNIHFFKVGMPNQQEQRNYQQVYREEIVENFNRNKLIVQSTQRLNSKNRSVLILVQQVNHGKILQEMFNQEGMDVEFVYGLDNMDKRDLEVYKLRTKKKLALIATTIADEGLDVPSLDAVILGGGGKSPSKGMQRIGRAIRIFGDKEEAFEIFSSTKQLLSENKNVLITVESIEKGQYIQHFFASLDESRGKYPMEIPFYHGDSLVNNKAEIFNNLATKKIPAMIVLADNISEEEVMRIEPLNSILVSVGEKFNAQKIQKTPSNIFFRELDMTLSQLTKEEFKEGKKPKELFNAERFGQELIHPDIWNKKTLIIVDETRHANAIKDFFKVNRKENGEPILEDIQDPQDENFMSSYIPQPILVNGKTVKLKYLTGDKAIEKIKPSLQDLINGKQNVLMINSAIIKESIDFHLFDYIFIVSDQKPAYVARELVQKDVRIFTKKDEAFVVDFIDNVKYCYGHSLERKLMFETESAFKITGWN